MIKIGITKEYKEPYDKRTPMTPSQSSKINNSIHYSVCVQKSKIRCFTNEEFREKKIKIFDNLSHCDLIIGIKEIPAEKLINNKTYLIFSHTIKKQEHNKNLLQTIINKNIKLIDYECLIKKNKRIIAFGKFAGIAGAYNTLMAYGIKYNIFHLKRLQKFKDLNDLYKQNLKIKINNPLRILITGTGRVSQGSKELLKSFQFKKVSVDSFLNKQFKYPIYSIINSSDYYKHKNEQLFNKEDFYLNPRNYISDFKKFIGKTDILINGTFWNEKSSRLFEEHELDKNFKIKVIGDISCDINGSIPCTKIASTIEKPFFDYCPKSKKIKKAFSNKENITIMSIDNLASELPRDSSKYFGKKLVEEVLPLFLNDNDKILENATITNRGKLLNKYKYLDSFIN